MTRKKKLWLVLGAIPVLLVLLFVLFIGPWPVYGNSNYAERDYYRTALAAIGAHAANNTLTDTPGLLQAGWAERDITPKVGVPLGGYSGREGEKKSTGVRDALHVRAMALGDGVDRVVLVGSDMLIIPPNLSAAVREAVARQCDLTADEILFNASHTHCGPGAFMPGLISEVSGGAYDEEMVAMLVERFSESIVEALRNMEPASLASGSVDASEYIRNRMRDGGPVDPELSFLVVKQADGDQCYLASFSAHPTNFGANMMEFSAEYPGELVRFIASETSADAQYLGGAVGSMGPKPPPGEDDSHEVVAMGRALGALILAGDDTLNFSDRLDVASVGIPVGMPEFQIRPFEENPEWRISPLLTRLLGLRREGWIHGARVGDLFFVGMPFDFSGETSVKWKAWASDRGLDLWALSFCSTYCGYLSPDEYYRETPLNYETGAMSWYGPNVEAYYGELFRALVGQLTLAEEGS